MHDFDELDDFGKWLDFRLHDDADPAILEMHLNTIDFDGADAATGWSLRYGHLFFAFDDQTVQKTLDTNIVVEFDMKISSEARPDAYPGKYSGSRIMVGALLGWREAPPRKNESHFLEVDLVQSPEYSASYHEPRFPLCQDRAYDRCFYSNNGDWAEGRFVTYATPVEAPLRGSAKWRHFRIPVSDLARHLRWVSAPQNWSDAVLKGIYVGIESEGATRSTIEIRNYDVFSEE